MLSDFGVARVVEDDSMEETVQLATEVGTRLYWAPERWDEMECYGKRSEVWALAAILYEMRMGSSLFSASKGKKRYRM